MARRGTVLVFHSAGVVLAALSGTTIGVIIRILGAVIVLFIGRVSALAHGAMTSFPAAPATVPS